MSESRNVSVPVLPASPSQADQTVYAALKLWIYNRIHNERAAGTRLAVDSAGRLEPPSFFQGLTARRVRKLIEPAGPEATAGFTDLYNAAPQLFYQRLVSLNHGLVLQATDQRFRRNKVFAWREPLYEKNLCTMAAIAHHVGERFHLGVDMIRLYEAFADRPFSNDQFFALFQDRLSAVLRRHGTDSERAHRISHGASFLGFLSDRRKQLRAARLLDAETGPDGPGAMRLTNAGFEVGLYLDLFLHNIWIRGRVPYCTHCGKPAPTRPHDG